MPRPRGDSGDSLVEILAALTILGIGITALMTALATHVSTTTANRNQAQANNTLLSAAEYVKALTYTTAQFSSCAPTTATSVTTAQLPRDATYSVSFGPGHALSGTACSALVVVPVTVTGNGFTLTLDVVKRP